MADELGDPEAARGLRLRQDVDVEMGVVPHRDHRADHDDPDEAEPRQLLGPDVAGHDPGVAGQHLHRDGHDERRDQECDRDAERPVEEVEEAGHRGDERAARAALSCARVTGSR